MSTKSWDLVMFIIIVLNLWCLNFREKDNLAGILMHTGVIVLAIINLVLNNRGVTYGKKEEAEN